MGVNNTAPLFPAAKTLVTETIEVPELGETLTVRAFNVAARQAYFAPVFNAESEEARRAGTLECDEARLVAFTVVDADGKLRFAESDIPRLREEVPATAIDRIAAVARRLNGLGVAAQEQSAKN